MSHLQGGSRSGCYEADRVTDEPAAGGGDPHGHLRGAGPLAWHEHEPGFRYAISGGRFRQFRQAGGDNRRIGPIRGGVAADQAIRAGQKLHVVGLHAGWQADGGHQIVCLPRVILG